MNSGAFTGWPWIAASTWAYPVLEVVHIVGIALLLGNLVLLEIRVWGAAATLPLPALARVVLPLVLTGFGLCAASGGLMFASQPLELLGNRAFVVKMGLLIGAGSNAALFHARGGLQRLDRLARLQAGLLEHPGQHRGGGGLAVGAGHRQHMAAGQNMLGQPLRAAGVGQPGVEDGLHQRIAARHHVADDELVGLQRQLLGAETFQQLDAERLQLLAHRRVDVGVAARHPVTGLAGDGGDAAHEGAADAEDVDVHGCRF